MLLLFAATLFVSAFLLFLVQPMIGKMLLPRLGGTPAVWNTCMVFFQAALLAGYGYTHSVSTVLPVRRQLILHGGLLLLPLLLLVPPLGPFGIGNWEPPATANPIFAVLWLLTLVVGLPFIVVATSAPLLQKWFGNTGHASAKDPYFLYGASNLGSMLALIAYPLWVEQGFDLDHQSTLWAYGYGLFLVGTVLCGLMVWAAPPPVQLAGTPAATIAPTNNPSSGIQHPLKQGRGRKLRLAVAPATPGTAATPAATDADRITNWRRLRWVALAAAPSSLMLGVITFITNDIAAVPLFWVIPLALYLLSFILVFLRWPVQWLGLPHRLMLMLQPVALLLLGLVALLGIAPTWLLLTAHVLAFFLTTMVCHGELARDRPSTRRLTEFYLWMSVGGVVGGLFNALLAPVVFKSYVEYPLVLVMACALRPPLKIFNRWFGFDREDSAVQERLLDLGYAICLGLFSFALVRISKSESLWGKARLEDYSPLEIYFMQKLTGKANLDLMTQTTRHASVVLNAGIIYGLPILICIGFAGRPLRFGLSLFAMLLVSFLLTLAEDTSLYASRTFYGVRRVMLKEVRDRDGNLLRVYHELIHGGISHGTQRVFPEADRNDAITYFHPKGPVGELFSHFKNAEALRKPTERRPFGVIGLGIGSLAAYGLSGQHVDFYEIDPAVRDLSLPQQPGQKTYFYYLQDAIQRGVKVEVDIGDGRLRLKQARRHYYQIFVVDAFSSDAIPVHLLTMEALELYLDKLAPDGVLIFNVTNNFVTLPPVLADQALEKGLICLHKEDHTDPNLPEKFSAEWVILARKDRRSPAQLTAQLVGLAAQPGASLGLELNLMNALAQPHLEWPPLLRQLRLKSATYDRGWEVLQGNRERRVWRDNYTNLFGVMTWWR